MSSSQSVPPPAPANERDESLQVRDNLRQQLEADDLDQMHSCVTQAIFLIKSTLTKAEKLHLQMEKVEKKLEGNANGLIHIGESMAQLGDLKLQLSKCEKEMAKVEVTIKLVMDARGQQE